MGFSLLVLLTVLFSNAFSQTSDTASTPTAGVTIPAEGAPNHFQPDGAVTGWMPWPLVHWRSSEEETMFAVHPFYRRRIDHNTGDKTTDILWPLFRRAYRAETPTKTNKHYTVLTPLAYSEAAEKDGKPFFHRFILPLYFEGKGVEGGRYFIFFPFLWYAREADLAVPLFPPRPQTFTAVWPLAGNFHHYWNRDTIRFTLWPGYVYSKEGEGENKVELHSVLWPFFGWYSGKNIFGFRLWPLVSHISRPGEFKRGYFLWPLGHYGKELTPEAGDDRPREMFLFLPFYGRVRDQLLDYDLLFPFYGRLSMKGRKVRGYAAAIYNEDDNLRQGVREHRLFWFLIRWTTDIPVDPQFIDYPGEEIKPPMKGGGFFPFYLQKSNEKKLRQTILWPIYNRRRDIYEDYTFRRQYLMPFYGNQKKEFADGRIAQSKFIFPFYRKARSASGMEYHNVPHFFPYSTGEAIDRNWAPLWSAWTQVRDHETGAEKTRLLGPVWQYDRDWLGVERRELNLGLVQYESWAGEHRPSERRMGLFWGLIEHHRLGGDGGLSVLGKRLW